MLRDKRPSLDDITGNRRNNPTRTSPRFSSEATRNSSLSPLAGDMAGNPFGDPGDYSFSAAEAFLDPLENDVTTFFNSRLDLVYELPSTARNRFTAR